MKVTFVDSHNRKEVLSADVTSYILPMSGKIVIKEIAAPIIYINGDAHQVENSSAVIVVEMTTLNLEVDDERYDIRVLCRKFPEEILFDYNILGSAYTNNLIQDRLDEVTLDAAIDENMDNLKISLCTFNRKFDSITKNQDIEGIARCIDKFPHIFKKPKQHLKQVNDIRPAAVVSRIGQESISHLASHSEHWKGIKASGLIPERLLARTLVDDYAIYENVAVKTMVDKLYKEMKKLNEENLDCVMQIEMDDAHSVSSEQKNYYHARDKLLKGMDDNSIILNQLLLEEQREHIQKILKDLGECKSTPLYRILKRQRPITGKLKKTNIFMMDRYYKYAYELWELMQNRPQASVYDGIQEITNEYTIFCKILFIFALKYFRFEADDIEADILENNKFLTVGYSIDRWHITLNDVYINELSIDAFSIEMFIDNTIPVDVSKFDISDNIVKACDCARIENGRVIFSKILSDKEREDLVKNIQDSWPKNKQKRLSSELNQVLQATFTNYQVKSEKILFVPWKYLLPDNVEESRRVLEKIKKIMTVDGYNKVYLLTASRPNEFTNIDDVRVLNSMLCYGYADTRYGIEQSKFGVIPISLSDINSYRRYTKVLLGAMIKLDSERHTCPICGGNMSKGKGNTSNIASCRTCGFQIINTQCSCCKEEYVFTRYAIPKTTTMDSDVPGFKIISRENELGYKNITAAIIEDEQINPICPKCGQ